MGEAAPPAPPTSTSHEAAAAMADSDVAEAGAEAEEMMREGGLCGHPIPLTVLRSAVVGC